VVCYSLYGPVETTAGAIAQGACEIPDTKVTVKRVPELIPEERGGLPESESRRPRRSE